MWKALIAFRFLGRNPNHSISFIRSLALPIIVMISVLGLVNGLGSEIQSVSQEVGRSDTALIYQENAPTSHESNLNWSILEFIQQQPEVKVALPYISSVVSIYEPTSRKELQVEVYGVSLEQFMDFHTRAYVQEGSLPSENSSYELTLGSRLSEILTLKGDYPAHVTLQAELTLVANVTGKIENAGRYSGAIICSPEFFVTLFPSLSSRLTFVEVEFYPDDDSRKSAEIVRRNLSQAGYLCEIIVEQGQDKISKQILNDISTIFWTFSIVTFAVVALQIHFATKWIGLHFLEEFRILKTLGTRQTESTLIILLMALLLGNLAFGMALLIGLPLGTASMALLTLFSGTSRFYAGIELFDIAVLLVLSNIAIIIGACHQAWMFGRN
ncbi:MAG: hypothetical protein ACE5OZ_03265 [Candidatus Heimdallarchaeota archaeon]